MISCKEVFCSELPSPSNIFLCNTVTTTSECNYQFASERHSLTLQTSYKDEEDEGCYRGAPSKKKKKEYALLVERLQQKKSNTKIEIEQSSTATTITCLAHSSLQLNNNNGIISIQAFAIMSGESNSNTNNTTTSSSSHDNDHQEATLSDTHNNTSLGTQQHDGGSSGKEKVVVVQSSNNNNNHYNSGEMDKKHTTSGDENGTTSLVASKYTLMIKCRFVAKESEEGEITTTATTTERIHLDFRPISVHVTQLYTSSSSSSSATTAAGAAAMDDDDGSSPPLIGIFVAGNDNKMHFFITTKQALTEKLFQVEESVVAAGGTTATAARKSRNTPSCFQPSFCFETIDPSNVVISTSCVSSNNSNECYDHLSEQDSVGNNPLMFETPIMAIDTCISEGFEETSSPASSSSPTSATTNVNRLAIACYDGVVRILTYTIQSTSDANIIRIARLHYSTFIVDGPVATLHFGNMTKQYSSGQSSSSICDVPNEEGEDLLLCCNNSNDNLFLLAGSLCGLAFLFYEVPPPPNASIEGEKTQSVSYPSFEGPVIIVDGLYDADNEGFEDCVTCVHAMTYHDAMILAVGTQGCRLLLFQQHKLDNTRKGSDESKALTADIEKKTKEMLHLLSEQDRLANTANDLRQKMLEIENSVQDEKVLHDDTITQSGAGDDNDGGTDDTKAEERVDKDGISIAPKIESLNSIKAEVDDVEQSRSNCTSMISQLQSSIDNLTGKLNDLSSPSPQLDSKAVRKMHRYEFLWEHKLPYPIQGISAVCSQSGELECYITTRQTIHIFRLLSSLMVDAAAASLERKMLSFSNTSNGGEA